MSELVTLVNRTQSPLTGVWDSKSFVLAPGKHEYSLEKAERFKAQHPVMGSENPRTGDMIYKLGIVELRDPIDPLTPEFLAQFEGAVEKWDRTKLTGSRPSEVVPGDNGIYSNRDVAANLPASTNFVNPL